MATVQVETLRRGASGLNMQYEPAFPSTTIIVGLTKLDTELTRRHTQRNTASTIIGTYT